jgi:hypothetical protein
MIPLNGNITFQRGSRPREGTPGKSTTAHSDNGVCKPTDGGPMRRVSSPTMDVLKLVYEPANTSHFCLALVVHQAHLHNNYT